MPKRGSRTVAAAAALALALGALCAAGPAHAAGLFDRILRILGLTAAPGQMKSDDGAPSPGRIWIADTERDARHPLTTGAGYRSPIFEPGGKSVLALEGSALVRVAVGAAPTAPRTLGRQPTVEKLVAFDPEHPADVLVLVKGPAPFAMLTVASGAIRHLPAPKTKDEQKLLAYARGEARQSGNLRAAPQTETRTTLEGKRRSTNVFVEASGAPPRNVSRCEDATCGEPSISPDTRQIVYVESRTDEQ